MYDKRYVVELTRNFLPVVWYGKWTSDRRLQRGSEILIIVIMTGN